MKHVPLIKSLLKLRDDLSLKKRQKIIIATFLITFSLVLSTQTVSFIFLKYRLIIALGLMAYCLSLWALWEGMTKLKAVMLLILPATFTMAVASFYFLLPVRWLTRLPMAILFGLSFYCLLLSQNVFAVAAERTIPLYRAASTASFIFTLITAFFLFNSVFALNLPFYLNGVVVFLLTLPLVLQTLWTIDMGKINLALVLYALILSLGVGECAIALSFWPVAPTVWSLFLSTMIYVLMGIVTDFIKNQLGTRLIWEYIGVGVVVLIFTFLVTSWG